MGRIAKQQDNSKSQQKQVVLLILLMIAGIVIAIRQFTGGPTSATAASENTDNVVQKDNTQDATKESLPRLTIKDPFTLNGDPFQIDESHYDMVKVNEIEIVEIDDMTPDVVVEIDPEAIKKQFKLKAVFGRETPRAPINDKVYTVGDEIGDGVVIERIAQRFVTVKAGKFRINFNLDQE